MNSNNPQQPCVNIPFYLQIFDASLKKKKKKKKTTFDIDAAMAEGSTEGSANPAEPVTNTSNSTTNLEETNNNNNSKNMPIDDDMDDGNLDLDLESFGKKKKKKKKPFNMEEIDRALPTAEFNEEIILESSTVLDEPAMDDTFDLDMDFSKTKKKKKKKKDLDELMAEADDKREEDKENGNYSF